MTPQTKTWVGRSALITGVIALFFGVRGCMSGPSVNVVAANDPRPDPNQPFANMNGAGCFINRAGHVQPQLQIPARADQATVARIISDYVGQIITDETRQLTPAANIAQHQAGAIAASIATYNAAVASGATPTMANQAAMVTAAQFLHNQGVMGPLICPVALGMDMGGIGVPRVQ